MLFPLLIKCFRKIVSLSSLVVAFSCFACSYLPWSTAEEARKGPRFLCGSRCVPEMLTWSRRERVGIYVRAVPIMMCTQNLFFLMKLVKLDLGDLRCLADMLIITQEEKKLERQFEKVYFLVLKLALNISSVVQVNGRVWIDPLSPTDCCRRGIKSDYLSIYDPKFTNIKYILLYSINWKKMALEYICEIVAKWCASSPSCLGRSTTKASVYTIEKINTNQREQHSLWVPTDTHRPPL